MQCQWRKITYHKLPNFQLKLHFFMHLCACSFFALLLFVFNWFTIFAVHTWMPVVYVCVSMKHMFDSYTHFNIHTRFVVVSIKWHDRLNRLRCIYSLWSPVVESHASSQQVNKIFHYYSCHRFLIFLMHTCLRHLPFFVSSLCVLTTFMITKILNYFLGLWLAHRLLFFVQVKLSINRKITWAFRWYHFLRKRLVRQLY